MAAAVAGVGIAAFLLLAVGFHFGTGVTFRVLAWVGRRREAQERTET